MKLEEIAKLASVIDHTQNAQVKQILIDLLQSMISKHTMSESSWPVQSPGCRVCGMGKNGEAMGYVCPRSDCPTRVSCQASLL